MQELRILAADLMAARDAIDYAISQEGSYPWTGSQNR
jgi:hypothetical protein